MDEIKVKMVEIEKTDDLNFILGQTHFIKSVEDLYEAMMNAVPHGKFAIAKETIALLKNLQRKMR
jgi:adenosine/AMP kinase